MADTEQETSIADKMKQVRQLSKQIVEKREERDNPEKAWGYEGAKSLQRLEQKREQLWSTIPIRIIEGGDRQ